MALVFSIFLGTAALELAVFAPIIWRARRLIGLALIAFLPAICTALALETVGAVSLLAWLVTAPRLLNLARLVFGRTNEKKLKRTTFQASAILLAAQLALFLLANSGLKIINFYLLIAVAGTQLVAAGILLVSTLRTVKKSAAMKINKHFSDRELPTLTVAIPARNETLDLERCLKRIVASDYPKLEIIVLDDCSHDRTPEILRSFAKEGVRFIGGQEPTNDWLAKNYAYNELLQESTGELILFCGVDVLFNKDSLRKLVTLMTQRKKRMMCILPANLAYTPIQNMRYWWELALPRRLVNRPPVLSSCWIANREKLNAIGGFKSAKHAVLPEATIAKQMIKSDDYSFILASEELGIVTAKTREDQRETAVRTLYPQLHMRPELTFALLLAEILVFIAPLAIAPIFALSEYPALAIIPIIGFGMLIYTDRQIIHATTCPLTNTAHSLTLPLAIANNLSLRLVSMINYEFKTVIWKGRNITFPAMQVYPPKDINLSDHHRN